MYKIDNDIYGFKLTFSGFIEIDEMKQWYEDSAKLLNRNNTGFHVFIDMRELKPLPSDSQKYMTMGQKLYKQKGMIRSAVILNDSITKLQFKRLAKETGIYKWERYIDASTDEAWETKGLNWLNSEIDPDE